MTEIPRKKLKTSYCDSHDSNGSDYLDTKTFGRNNFAKDSNDFIIRDFIKPSLSVLKIYLSSDFEENQCMCCSSLQSIPKGVEEG